MAGFTIVMTMLLFFFAVMFVGLIFSIAAIICLVQYTKAKKQLQSLSALAIADGIISDVRTQANPQNPRQTCWEIAVEYQNADGVPRTAFFAQYSFVPLPISMGQTVSLAMFPQPLTTVPQEVLDPHRGVNGKLPQQIYMQQWMGVPMDETASVMFRSDHEKLLQEFGKRKKRRLIASIIYGILGTILFIIPFVCIIWAMITG